MICSACNKEAFSIRVTYDRKNGRTEECNNCGTYSISHIPDVYWPGFSHTNPNITDECGNPITLTSRTHKASVMKELNISEAGDRVHGSVKGNTKYFIESPKRNREEIKTAVRKAKETIQRRRYGR